MKKITVLFAVCMFLLSACKKESKYKYSGTIDGFDQTNCEGYIIDIGGNAHYICPVLPQGNTIDPKSSHFPIKINFNYSTDGTKCLDNQIITITGMIITY